MVQAPVTTAARLGGCEPITLKEDLWIPKDSLVGHLSLELFDPGDYYNVDDTAHWARWELSYQF